MYILKDHCTPDLNLDKNSQFVFKASHVSSFQCQCRQFVYLFTIQLLYKTHLLRLYSLVHPVGHSKFIDWNIYLYDAFTFTFVCLCS